MAFVVGSLIAWIFVEKYNICIPLTSMEMMKVFICIRIRIVFGRNVH